MDRKKEAVKLGSHFGCQENLLNSHVMNAIHSLFVGPDTALREEKNILVDISIMNRTGAHSLRCV